MNLGKAILELRKSKRYKQKDVATALGKTQTYISQIEHNHKTPSMDLLVDICKLFKIPLYMLIFTATEDTDIEESKKQTYDIIKPIILNLFKSL